eukprot:SAG11_NODE_12841_length_683_cov_0.523973_2_plen_116_part_00
MVKTKSSELVVLTRCIVIHTRAAEEAGELGITAGEHINVTHKDTEHHWWTGSVEGSDGDSGMFPANFVLEFTHPQEMMALEKFDGIDFDLDNDGVRESHASSLAPLTAQQPRGVC